MSESAAHGRTGQRFSRSERTTPNQASLRIQVLTALSRFPDKREEAMTNRTQTGWLLVVLAAGLAGCDGGTFWCSPTAPAGAVPQKTGTPAQQHPTVLAMPLRTSHFRRGLRRDVAGRVPIDNVGVFLSDDHVHHTDATGSSASGQYGSARARSLHGSLRISPSSGWARWLRRRARATGIAWLSRPGLARCCHQRRHATRDSTREAVSGNATSSGRSRRRYWSSACGRTRCVSVRCDVEPPQASLVTEL